MKIKHDRILIQLICLFLAVILWVFVMDSNNSKADDPVTGIPVAIRNEALLENSGLTLVEQKVSTIDVTLTGYRSDLLNIKKEDIKAYIDVSGRKEGLNQISVIIEPLEGVEIKDYTPKEIACNIEALVTKTLDVEVAYKGNQANGYYVDDNTVNPASVIIKGPRSIVNSAARAVANVNLNGDSDTIVKSVPVTIYSDTGHQLPLDINPSIVEVTIPVLPTKYIEINPDIQGEPLEGYKRIGYTVEPERIKIAAYKSVIDSINEARTEPIDITGTFYPVTRSVNIINDNNYIIVEGTSKPTVKVQIEKIIKKDFVYSVSDINYVNIPEGLEVVNEDETDENLIVVTVEGVSSIINQFSKDDLKLKVDLTDGKKGINNVVISSETNVEMESIVINPETVDIKLDKVKAEVEDE